MPIFHIHLFNDDNVIDEAGQQFADVAEARAEAVRSGREIIAEHVIHGRPIHLDHHLVLQDDQGRRLETIYFRDVVTFDG